jgi:hypothetical protein
MKTKQLLTLAVIAMGMLMPATASAESSSLSAARAGTARYHNIDAALEAHYGLFTAQGIACIDNPGVGAMGIHYVNLDLVEKGAINAATPQALVYEPQANGRLRLVAVEYIAFQKPWDEAHSSRPSLFGHEFELVKAGNRYEIPAFYELHAWLWKNNPRGMFEDWNPLVSCAAGRSSDDN